MDYTFDLLKTEKLNISENADISKMEVTVDDDVKKAVKNNNFILCLIPLSAGIIFIICVFAIITHLLLDLNGNTLFSSKILNILITITIFTSFIACFGGLLFDFIYDSDDENIEEFLDEITEIEQNNVSINFDIKKEVISYFNEDGILHEIYIPEESTTKYWNKDYIKVNVTENNIVTYYPVGLRNQIEE